jgi:hypothetical protein
LDEAEKARRDRLGTLMKLVLAPGAGLEPEIAIRAWALDG